MDEKTDTIADSTAAPRWDAFLSYSSHDATIARRVQRFLEGYRLPDGRRLRIYRDETDISGGELPEQLRAALAASSCLLVCCSEAAAKSAWVSREIEAFRELAPGQSILPVILADDPPENLPTPLRDSEFRWADLCSGWRLGRPRRKTRVELIRAVAAAAKVDFRALLPLDQQRRRRHHLLVSIAITAVLMAVAWWPVVDWQDVTPVGQPLFGCDTLDDGIAFYQRNDQQAIKNIVTVTRAVFGPNPSQQILDANVLPRGRLLPGFVDSAIRAHCPVSSSGWIGAPAADVCMSLTRSDEVGDFDDPMGGGEASLTEVAVGERTFVLDVFWNDIDRQLWNNYGRTVDPSQGLPITAQSEELWLGFPAGEFTRGSLWHTSDGGRSWVQQDGVTDVHSVKMLSSGVILGARIEGELGFFIHSNEVFEHLDTPGKGDRLEVCGEHEGEPVVRADRRAYRRLFRPWWRTWFD